MYTLTTSYQCQNLYGKFNTFKLRWFPFFGVFTRLNVWTDEGHHVTIPQAAPYYRFSHVDSDRHQLS